MDVDLTDSGAQFTKYVLFVTLFYGAGHYGRREKKDFAQSIIRQNMIEVGPNKEEQKIYWQIKLNDKFLL